MQRRSWPATAAQVARAVAFAGLAALTTPAQARTADPQALLEALAPTLGGDCALANPLPAGAEVMAAMGAPAAWGAFCPAEGRAVLAAELPAAAGRWLETLAMQLLVANGNRPVSLADLAGKTLIQVSAGPGGALAIDRAPLPDPARLPGLLLDGTESPDWLPQAFSGGSFQDFAR